MFRRFWRRPGTIRNKKGAFRAPELLEIVMLFNWMNCLNRANISAGTTVGAYVRIDFIDVAF
jgi:hypothetical protein